MAIVSNMFFYFVLALFLLQPFHLAFARIETNTKLSTNDKNASWLSPSGEFAFGFLPINNNYNTNFFFLAIWFNKIQDHTIVWNADIQTPIPLGSMLWFTGMGLSLINPQGEAIYKLPSIERDTHNPVSYAILHDNGNFVMASSDSSYLWQSFNNPTDTLLPTQTLGLNSKLSSRLSRTNYTKGRFELYFDNGNLSLTQTGWQSRYTKYFDINTSSNDSASQSIFNSSVIGGEVAIGLSGSSLDVGRYYYRATLEYYGVFTLYSYPKKSNEDQVWSVKGYVPDNICTAIGSDMGSGSCGYNSYCIWDGKNKRPTCKCPQGYSWVDPKDEFRGCKPDLSLGCGGDDAESNENPQEVYEMEPLPDVNWPFGDYERLNDYTREECEKSCLNDCNCAAAISNAAKDCWKKRLPLSNGRIESYLNLTTALLKIRKKPLGHIEKEDQLQLQHALLGSLIGSLAVNTLLVATVVLVILLKTKKAVVVQVPSFLEATNVHSFTYEALKEATHEFTEEVGRGSFGIVYKGTLNSITNDTTVVAVKRLDRIARESEMEFRNELSSIGRTCQRNLVRLLGFCDEGVHRLLVYEFMINGTLADILFKHPKPTWNLRVNLALGVARGLLYLHEECETPIIHCDIKPQNILIDDHFMPKVSDFGLAKLLYSNKSRTHTMIRGTKGYVAPEWFKNVPVTVKVDVYSYGVMLLEIICCKRSVGMDLDEVEEEAILIDWVYDCYMERRLEILVGNDEEAISDIERMKKWVMIAIWCIQENPEIRPTMKTVMQMLEGLIEVPSPPFPALSFTSI